MLSQLAVAITAPSGRYTAALTASVCVPSLASSVGWRGSLMSQSRAVWSWLEVRSVRPSGLIATVLTWSVCPETRGWYGKGIVASRLARASSVGATWYAARLSCAARIGLVGRNVVALPATTCDSAVLRCRVADCCTLIA